MNRLITSIAALTILTIPSHALTLEQAQSEMGNHYIGSDGKTGTKNIPGIRTDTFLVSPAESGDQASTGGLGSHCPLMRTMNGGWAVRDHVNADCTPMSLNPGNLGSRPAVYGSETKDTCTTSVKVMDWNGPNTDRAGAWSVTSSSSTRDGSC